MELPRVEAPGRPRALLFSVVRSPGGTPPPRGALQRTGLLVTLAALALAFPGAATAGGPTPTRAATTARAATTVAGAPGAPVLVTNLHRRPAGFRLTAARALKIASTDQLVRTQLRRHPDALAYEYTKGPGTWQVSWFSGGRKPTEVIQVYVDDRGGRVTQVWTGFQVAWTMARGYPGAFGRRSNALYVWLPLCLAFLVPFLPLRRTAGGRRLALLHLDLLMLLGFSISLAFFNHAEIGLSVPLVYPFLLYLLVRMLLLAFGHGIPRRPLELLVPTHWLLSGAVFLLGLRIGLDILNSNVIDVGYAGVIGADKLIHGHLLYGLWPKDNAYGDTYGPINYYAYLPFRAIFGWSGSWDSLPAAHAAAVAFDLLTVAGLYRLGRRIRDHALGVVLLYAWVAYPFTLFTLSSNSNDALVAALVVLALLTVSSAPARGAGGALASGVAGALAGLTKFAPFALAPLLLRGTGERPRPRAAAVYMVAFAATASLAMLPVLLNGDLHFFWHDSIAYQSSRVTPFSIWGLWGGLGGVQHLLQGAVVGLAILVAFVPARRGLVEVAALGAAVLIALQLTVNYWLYPYIVWFFPLVALAIFAGHPERPAQPTVAVARDPDVLAPEPIAVA